MTSSDQMKFASARYNQAQTHNTSIQIMDKPSHPAYMDMPPGIRTVLSEKPIIMPADS